jgi:hypothetical protein
MRSRFIAAAVRKEATTRARSEAQLAEVRLIAGMAMVAGELIVRANIRKGAAWMREGSRGGSFRGRAEEPRRKGGNAADHAAHLPSGDLDQLDGGGRRRAE